MHSYNTQVQFLIRWNGHVFWGVGSGLLLLCCLADLYFSINVCKKKYECTCWNPISEITSPHMCAFSKPGHWLPTSYVMSLAFPMFRELEWLVRGDCSFFFYIGGIFDHHSLNLVFINVHMIIQYYT